MKVVKMLAAAMVIGLMFMLGCSGTESQLPGKWFDDKEKNSKNYIEFFSDKTVHMRANELAVSGTWSILSDGRIKVNFDVPGLGYKMISTGELKGKRLILDIDGNKGTLVKLKRSDSDIGQSEAADTYKKKALILEVIHTMGVCKNALVAYYAENKKMVEAPDAKAIQKIYGVQPAEKYGSLSVKVNGLIEAVIKDVAPDVNGKTVTLTPNADFSSWQWGGTIDSEFRPREELTAQPGVRANR